MKEFIDENIDNYCVAHTSPENDLLKRLNRETHAKVLQPRMLSGHFQGRFLTLLTKLLQPKLILEIGTYTGYSGLCFAEGLPENGKLISIDINEELERFTKSYFDDSPQRNQIDYRIGDASKIIPTIEGNFDMVFIDADKQNYINYFNLVKDRINKNGIIIADNILWSGKVVDLKQNDKDTVLLRSFNDLVFKDASFEKILLPIRDGLFIAQKK